MSEYKPFDLLESLRLMTQPARSQEWLKGVADQFWSNQDHMLDCMEKLHKGWLARRHEGTQAARSAAAAMLSAGNPATAVTEYQKWASGMLDRMMADASAVQQLQSVAAISMFEPISSPLTTSAPTSKIPSVTSAA